VEEVRCCGRFVGMLLEEDSEEEGDGDEEWECKLDNSRHK
jgi:hypothetical protein